MTDAGSGPGDPGAWARLRAALFERGWRPSRRLGQNLLTDANLARALARDAGVGPGDFVLEVGPGAGALTAPLLDLGVELVAVEIDDRLLAAARAELSGRAGLRFVHADVLAGKHALAPEVLAVLPEDRPWHLVSNLPYAVSGPLLAVLAGLPSPPQTMAVLVQREVADRIAAEPGTRDWGPLSVRLQTRYRVHAGRRVPATVFWPRPQVESRVVRLELDATRPERAEIERLDRLVDVLFGRRRQALRRVLADALEGRQAADAALADLGLDGARRAETLSVEELFQLAAHPSWAHRGGPRASSGPPGGT